MGICQAKAKCEDAQQATNSASNLPFFTPSPLSGGGKRRSRPFPPPSPAKHIKELIARRHGGSVKPNQATIPEDGDGDVVEAEVNREFGYSTAFLLNYEIGEEVGRGHFGFVCRATAKKGALKGANVAVKILPKLKVWIFETFKVLV